MNTPCKKLLQKGVPPLVLRKKVNMRKFSRILVPFLEGSLVKEILFALVIGIIVALVAPGIAVPLGFLGTFFRDKQFRFGKQQTVFQAFGA